MARQLRIEYEGAYYHVLSRGNNQQAIFLSDHDRNTFLQTLARQSERFEVEMIGSDMLIYHLWQSGRFSNSEIGSQIGLTISSISRRAGNFQSLLDRDKKVQTTYHKFKSIIKL